MSQIVGIIQSLQSYRKAGKPTKADIADAEISLRLSFSDEYKEYLEDLKIKEEKILSENEYQNQIIGKVL